MNQSIIFDNIKDHFYHLYINDKKRYTKLRYYKLLKKFIGTSGECRTSEANWRSQSTAKYIARAKRIGEANQRRNISPERSELAKPINGEI